MTFGDKLQELLKQRNMSQEKLAKQIDVSQTMVSEYCKNRSVLAMKMWRGKLLAKIFGVRLDWLFDDGQEWMSEEDQRYEKNVWALIGMLGYERAYARLAKVDDADGGQGRATPLPRPTLQGPRHETGTGTEPTPRQGGGKGGGSRRSSG